MTEREEIDELRRLVREKQAVIETMSREIGEQERTIQAQRRKIGEYHRENSELRVSLMRAQREAKLPLRSGDLSQPQAG